MIEENLHTFVISAYRESEYLERCIISLMNQTVKSRIVICTSTPNQLIQSLTDKYHLELHIRYGESDIQDDWNYACSHVNSQWVTVAHQDDVYNEKYLENILGMIHKYPDSIMMFTDYRPIIHGDISIDRNCKIQRILRFPMKFSLFAKSKFFKKYFLSLGNCVRCPSVCYHKADISGPIFTSTLKFSLDWDTFVKFSQYEGRFVYIDKPLVYYRIHEKATTMSFITNNKRKDDDIYMFRKFWPEFLVKIIMKAYTHAYDTYFD